jgi:hypothetical protein
MIMTGDRCNCGSLSSPTRHESSVHIHQLCQVLGVDLKGATVRYQEAPHTAIGI